MSDMGQFRKARHRFVGGCPSLINCRPRPASFRKRHDRPSARAEGGDGADPALVEDLRETIGVGEIPDVAWHGESTARATCEVDQVVADIWQVVSTEREDARHGVKIGRRGTTYELSSGRFRVSGRAQSSLTDSVRACSSRPRFRQSVHRLERRRRKIQPLASPRDDLVSVLCPRPRSSVSQSKT